jgi:hypothetical protein
MKKFFKVLIIAFFVVCPSRVHASGLLAAGATIAAEAAGSAAIVAALEQIHAVEIIKFISTAKETADTARDTYKNLQKLIDAEKRSLKNIQSIVDIRSVSDFVNWTNRTMYLAREEEYYYNQMGIKIGNNTYKMHEINQIPDAMRNSFRDPYDGDFTEDEKRDMWIRLGLTPGNYNYMKTWEERNDKIAKRILTYSDVFADEFEEAAERNQNIMDKYRESGDDLDINEIEKEAHITAMNTEMAIREQTRLMVEMHEYQLSRDRLAAIPPSPPKRSDFWDEDPFGSISGGHGVNNYENW